ncbi:DUF1501 domain-containing protein [Variovorax sp. 770b2]|uniref:DUF1501 domain-containing protein n=1 Tax=Variovorax sp. 770b2 TaxID=1566271 RepID=UPI0008F081F2|nr:DUF1501 domain-containing protein [Variovorax sp. 770b2]SFP35058.1 Uncharacterized conserved protein, DUF1501 family [Variovorax sp. 770b2]
MYLINPAEHTRRAFLRRTGQLAMAGTALPFALNLAAMGEAAAQAAPGDDYRALVCVFLFGGNDYANTVVTYDADSYGQYSLIRGGDGEAGGGIAIARAALAATELKPTQALPGGRVYALHPSMTGLADLFNNQGKVAVQLNVGPLIKPLTRAQYNSSNRRDFPIPPKLFSHNDQQSVWQSSSPEGSTVGWGGNLGDLALAPNSGSLFTCMSVAGNAVFLSGDQALQYQVGTGGAVRIGAVSGTGGNLFGSATVKAAMQQIAQRESGHTLENEYTKVIRRAVSAEGKITEAIQSDFPSGTFPAQNNLADQLKMVARLIRGREALGVKRQVFFVSMGGFDLHDDLIARQPGLMKGLSEALVAFHNQMGVLGVADKVTAFTASDFGRTLSSNSNGSDHGWGSHHLVVGGAVKGKALYGTAPPVSITNTASDIDQWHVGQGRLLPTTSVDQYAGTLARWFGVPDDQLDGILPNLRNFGMTAPSGIAYPRNVGFMA